MIFFENLKIQKNFKKSEFGKIKKKEYLQEELKHWLAVVESDFLIKELLESQSKKSRPGEDLSPTAKFMRKHRSKRPLQTSQNI